MIRYKCYYTSWRRLTEVYQTVLVQPLLLAHTQVIKQAMLKVKISKFSEMMIYHHHRLFNAITVIMNSIPSLARWMMRKSSGHLVGSHRRRLYDRRQWDGGHRWVQFEMMIIWTCAVLMVNEVPAKWTRLVPPQWMIGDGRKEVRHWRLGECSTMIQKHQHPGEPSNKRCNIGFRGSNDRRQYIF